MNDPHVESLTYGITKRDTVDFDKAEPLPPVDKGAFQVTIDAYRATVTMHGHFATAEEARAVVEPFLRAWEFRDDLHERNGLRFKFEKARVVDRQQQPSPGRIVRVVSEGITVSEGRVTAHVGRGRWPDPPDGLAVSPDAEIMRRCWLSYCRREWPMAAAYMALTVLEATAQMALGGPARSAACSYYNVSRKVLNMFGDLTSKRGGDEARKAEGLHAPLSPNERKWIEAAFKALVLRAAERAYHGAPPPRQLTMVDLPEL